MHDWLPSVAAVGIGVDIAARWELTWIESGFLCGGLSALFMMFCH